MWCAKLSALEKCIVSGFIVSEFVVAASDDAKRRNVRAEGEVAKLANNPIQKVMRFGISTTVATFFRLQKFRLQKFRPAWSGQIFFSRIFECYA